MSENRALIFANGTVFHAEAVQALLRADDYLIAADGGLRYVHALGLQPHLLIGDLDSVTPEEMDAMRRLPGVQIDQHPAHKNETDLELAVDAALKTGAETILIIGALGGRLDMTLSNIFLLMLPELESCDARLEDGMEEVFLIRPGKGGAITGSKGDTVSLLPWGGPADGVRTEDLYYPLRGETLLPERSRGISNEMTSTTARVTLERGLLICVHTRKTPPHHLNEEIKE